MWIQLSNVNYEQRHGSDTILVDHLKPLGKEREEKSAISKNLMHWFDKRLSPKIMFLLNLLMKTFIFLWCVCGFYLLWTLAYAQIDAFEISFKRFWGLSVKSCMNVDICGEQSNSETLLKLAEYQMELLGRKENEKKKSATLLPISEAACLGT